MIAQWIQSNAEQLVKHSTDSERHGDEERKNQLSECRLDEKWRSTYFIRSSSAVSKNNDNRLRQSFSLMQNIILFFFFVRWAGMGHLCTACMRVISPNKYPLIHFSIFRLCPIQTARNEPFSRHLFAHINWIRCTCRLFMCIDNDIVHQCYHCHATYCACSSLVAINVLCVLRVAVAYWNDATNFFVKKKTRETCDFDLPHRYTSIGDRIYRIAKYVQTKFKSCLEYIKIFVQWSSGFWPEQLNATNSKFKQKTKWNDIISKLNVGCSLATAKRKCLSIKQKSVCILHTFTQSIGKLSMKTQRLFAARTVQIVQKIISIHFDGMKNEEKKNRNEN